MCSENQDLQSHSKLHSPSAFVCICLLVSLGLFHALTSPSQLLPHCGSHFSGCRCLGAHATSQVQGLAELLAVGQGIRRLLGGALQVSIEAHFTEKQLVNPLVWWTAQPIRVERLFDYTVCPLGFTIHLWMVSHAV